MAFNSDSLIVSLAKKVAEEIGKENLSVNDVPVLSEFHALPRREIKSDNFVAVNVTPDSEEMEISTGALKKITCNLNISILKTLTTKDGTTDRDSEIADCERLAEAIMNFAVKTHTFLFQTNDIMLKGVITKAKYKPLFAANFVNAMTTFAAFGEFVFTVYAPIL